MQLHCLSTLDDIASPLKVRDLSLESSALKFFIDFYQVAPLVIEYNLPAVEVQLLMRKAHVRLKFVIDKNNHFMGLITSDDLSDDKIIKKVSKGYKREDIPLTEFMTKKDSLKALAFKDVEQAEIKEVIAALKDSGQQHVLVVDQGAHKIRGVFSASDISRMLHLPIKVHDTSSFYHVFTALSHGMSPHTKNIQ